MENFDVKILFSMQDGFRRSSKTMNEMMTFIANGGVFDQETLQQRTSGRTDPIILNRFEDDRVFVHDGLHRVASILKARPSGLIHHSEYRVQQITYAEYQQINTSANYFTPFDPRIEVRVADFAEFKSRVIEIIQSGNDPTEFVENNRHLYVRPRQAHHDSIERLIEFFHPDLAANNDHSPSEKLGEIS